jgi:hypothetical protein
VAARSGVTNTCTTTDAATNTNSTQTSVHGLRKAGGSEGHPTKREDSLHHGSASNLDTHTCTRARVSSIRQKIEAIQSIPFSIFHLPLPHPHPT